VKENLAILKEHGCPADRLQYFKKDQALKKYFLLKSYIPVQLLYTFSIDWFCGSFVFYATDWVNGTIGGIFSEQHYIFNMCVYPWAFTLGVLFILVILRVGFFLAPDRYDISLKEVIHSYTKFNWLSRLVVAFGIVMNGFMVQNFIVPGVATEVIIFNAYVIFHRLVFLFLVFLPATPYSEMPAATKGSSNSPSASPTAASAHLK